MVRVAHAEPRPGPARSDQPGLDPRQPELRPRGFLVVLADDAGHRALPAWVGEGPRGVSLPDLIDRPADDIWTSTRIPEELAVRLVDAAGGSVTGVEIYPITANPGEVNADTCAALIELGARHVTARLDHGLRLAVVAGAPVRVDGALIDRLAVPAPADDPAAPFRSTAAGPGHLIIARREGRVLQVPAEPPAERPRFEPRNMTFADGLARWQLEAAAPDDYSAAAEDSGAVLSSAIPEPSGSAALLQTVFADDFAGTAVVFRGEFRTENVADGSGLCLRIRLQRKEPEPEREHLVTTAGTGDWSSDQISAQVPEDADTIRFGIVLSGRGRVWLRNPVLRRDDA
jgi:hypothetical protein